MKIQQHLSYNRDILENNEVHFHTILLEAEQINVDHLLIMESLFQCVLLILPKSLNLKIGLSLNL